MIRAFSRPAALVWAGLVLAMALLPCMNATAWAGASLVYDMQHKVILAETQADDRRAPASLVKCMTALLVYDAVANGTVALDDMVAAPPEVAAVTGSRIGLQPGQLLPASELLTALLVGSANDAAVALAVHVAGSLEAFLQAMNAKAAALGMADTRFATPHGLPAANQYSTARDLARLGAALIARHPQALAITSRRTGEVMGVHLQNRNDLLGLPGVDGLKTGATAAAGSCILVTAQREGRRLLVVVLGAADAAARAREAAALLEQGFATPARPSK